MIKKKFSAQFGKFVFVGILNTIVDLSVLNALIFFAPSTNPYYFIFLKLIAFASALIFSFYSNKYFVFHNKKIFPTKNKGRREGGAFIVVSLMGLLLNVSVSSCFFYTLIGLDYMKTSVYLPSLSGMLGSLVTMAWNYYGYKTIVFNKTVYTI